MRDWTVMRRPMAVGTVIRAGAGAAEAIRTVLPHGFECFQIIFTLKREVLPDLRRLAAEVMEVVGPSETFISGVGVYGNPLRDDEVGRAAVAAVREGMRVARLLGTDLVSAFTGRIPGSSVPESLPRFKEVWSELMREAEDLGVRVAFENCLQGGTWQCGDMNMAQNPAAWELLFAAVPSRALGLEWEPAHQIMQMIDPVAQLAEWRERIFHVHGKDGKVDAGVLDRCGVYGGEWFARHRFPSLGDSSWLEIMRLLDEGGYVGTIDIEGFHDPVYRDERELEGQLLALEHLRECRRKLAGDAGVVVPRDTV